MSESNVIVLKLNNHKVPEFKEVKGKSWVIFGNEAPFYNRYPDYLIELYNRSPYHHAIINAKANFIAGNGVEIDRRGLKVGQVADLNDKVYQANKYGETIADVLFKCTLDKQIFNSCYIEVIWTKDKKDFEFYHIEFSYLRRDVEDNGYWYSEDWKRVTTTEQDEYLKTKKPKSIKDGGTNLKFIPDFDPEKPVGSQIYTLRGYRPGIKWYSIPNYSGCIPYIEADMEVANFDLNRIKTGFFVGTVLNFPGKPNKDEQADLEKKLKEKFTGTDRANSILLTFSRDKDTVPTVVRLSPDELDGQFTTLTKNIQQSIFAGHRITNPTLFGIKSENVVFERGNIIESWELFKRTYVESEQTEMENWVNKLMEHKGFSKRIKLKETFPINALDSATIVSVMTKEEIREKAGLPKIPQVSKFSSEEITPEEETQFADDEMKIFSEYGVLEDEYDVFGGDIIEFTNLKINAFGILDGEVKEIYRSILDQLSKDPLITNESIAKVLKVKPERISNAITALEKAGAIKIGKDKSGSVITRTIEVTAQGIDIIDEQGSKVSEIEVRYSYQPRPGLLPVIETTRPFCKKMLDQKKLFTRAELDTLGERLGYNVWTDRGGWWTRKGGKIKTPYCRHVWQSVVVRKKKEK